MYAAVVRFVVQDDRRAEFREFGSGTIIGIYEAKWLIACTASHVFEHVWKLLEPQRKPLLMGYETPEEREARKFDWDAILPFFKVGVCIPSLGREVFCPIGCIAPSKDRRKRDTALVCAPLPENLWGLAVSMPISVMPPPTTERACASAGLWRQAGARTAPH